MRQFRGLTKDGKWVYGWYFELDGMSFIENQAEKSNNRCTVEVIPETVSQQIGFEDKNKKSIYEGDFCKFSNWKPKKIIWVDGRYMLGDTLVICCKMECDKMEIIFDNDTK